jgi:hypothetical protein
MRAQNCAAHVGILVVCCMLKSIIVCAIAYCCAQVVMQNCSFLRNDASVSSGAGGAAHLGMNKNGHVTIKWARCDENTSNMQIIKLVSYHTQVVIAFVTLP